MAKDAKNNKDIKNKKHFFKDFKAELKKVIWPTPKQIVNSTVAVVTIVLIAAVIVFVLDLVFDLFNEKIVNKFKADIKNKVVVEENIVTETLEENTETTETTEQDNNENTVENESSVENVQ
ncbi:MAG: preprotein translocase subunit SecE [Clostridia bacterium]|nr:preprotein translocase subunit SecE [Clostridia bacterium]